MAPAVPSGYSTGVQTHRENPSGKVINTGSGYAARNERWYLHDRKGRRFTFRSYDWLWAANIAIPATSAAGRVMRCRCWTPARVRRGLHR